MIIYKRQDIIMAENFRTNLMYESVGKKYFAFDYELLMPIKANKTNNQDGEK